MKTIFKLQVLVLFASLVYSSCKKDETKVLFEDGTPPVLTVSDSSDRVLANDTANKVTFTFSWTNPNYTFNTGASSQDVTYILQVDTVGADFTNPNRQDISISKDLSKTFTAKELNKVLAGLDVLEDVPHNIEFRLYSSLGNSSVKLYSNTITMVITPYLDVAVPLPPGGHLYITGSATQSDWTNTPPESQEVFPVSKVEYVDTIHFDPGKQYKFLSTLSMWQPQYGKATGDKLSGTIGYNFGLQGQSDPAAFDTPDDAGTYVVDLNFKTGKYSVTKQ